MALPDLTKYTDEKLDDLRLALLNEVERREALATIPDTIRILATKYVEGGGDIADLSVEPA